jgi:hypothetical protein
MTEGALDAGRGGGPAPPSSTAEPVSGSALSRPPPLSVVATVAAVFAMAVNRVVLPASNDPARLEFLLSLGRWGSFATNLTGVAGLCALSVALYEIVRTPEYATLRRRLLIATFAGILLPSVALSTFFPREHTTGEMVLFGIGAANVLVVAVTMNAARFARPLLPRLTLVLFAAMALFSMVAQVLILMARARLDAWQLSVAPFVRGIGEACFLLALFGAAALSFPMGRGVRRGLARAVSVTALLLAAGGFHAAQAGMRGDFALLLHHAQRVTLFIDTVPILYAVPLSVSLSTALGGLVSGSPARVQTGVGVILLLTAGYSPHAPERLLTLTLAMALLSRAVIASARRQYLAETAASGEA